MLRCELFVDRVSKLEVLTTTRTMYKDDIERFDIQSFDSAGNKFSSIEGLAFEWGIQQTKTQHAATSILKFVPFKDSGIEASDLIKAIEDDGKQAHAVLVRGKLSSPSSPSSFISFSLYASPVSILHSLTSFMPSHSHPLFPRYPDRSRHRQRSPDRHSRRRRGQLARGQG